MRIRSISISGLSTSSFIGGIEPFDHEVPDEPGLIAIVGPNGSGKSHLLAALGPATLYRTMPGYGDAIANHINPSVDEMFIKLAFEIGGSAYQSRISTSRAGSSLENFAELTTGDTKIAGPSVRMYDSAIAKLFPSEEMFLASVFWAPGSTGTFLRMTPANRKALLAQLLRISRYAPLAKAASDQASSHTTNVATLRKKLDEMRRDLEAVALARASHRGAMLRAAALGDEIASLRLEQGKISERLGEIAATIKQSNAEEARAARREIADQIRETNAKLARLSDEKTAASEFDHGLIELAKVDSAKADNLLSVAEVAASVAQEEWEAAALVSVEIQAEEHKRADLTRRIADLKKQHGLLSIIEQPDSELCQRCPLTKSAYDAKALSEKLASELEAMPGTAVDPEPAKLKTKRAADEAVKKLRVSADSKRRYLNGLLEASRSIRPLDSIELEIESTSCLLRSLRARHDAIVIVDCADLVAEERELRAKVASLEGSVANLEQEKAEKERSVALWNKAIEDGPTPADISVAEVTLAESERTLLAYRMLADGLGRNGVPAIEMDAALPAISEIANTLLATPFGGRFSVRLSTQVEKKDGDKKESLDVRIEDGLSGRVGLGVSSGESVVIDEAIRLALAIYAVRYGGYDLRTLYRDEATGALSYDNANAYVELLRQAQVVGGFEHVFFIAHQDYVYDQADWKIMLAS